MSEQQPPQQPAGYYPPPNWQPMPPQQEDEIDLLEIWRTLVANKKLIIAITFATTLIATIAALVMTPVYRAEVLLAPVSREQGGGLSALAGQFGGIASMAGISIPSNSNVDVAIATMNSREFINRFIEKHNIKPILFKDRWDDEKKTWIPERFLGFSLSHEMDDVLSDERLAPDEPTAWDSYELFKGEVLFIKQDAKTSHVKVFIDLPDKRLAAQWANSIVDDINSEMRQRAIEEAELSIKYLKNQLNEISVADLRAVLFTLVEEQIKNATLAKVNDQYAFRIIDRAVPQQEPIKPKKVLLTIFGLLIGMAVGLAATYIKKTISDNESRQ